MVQFVGLAAMSLNLGLCVFSVFNLVQVFKRRRQLAEAIKEARELLERVKIERENERKELEVSLAHASQLLDDARRLWGDANMNAKSIENVHLLFDAEGVIRCPYCFTSVIKETQ